MLLILVLCMIMIIPCILQCVQNMIQKHIQAINLVHVENKTGGIVGTFLDEAGGHDYVELTREGQGI